MAKLLTREQFAALRFGAEVWAEDLYSRRASPDPWEIVADMSYSGTARKGMRLMTGKLSVMQIFDYDRDTTWLFWDAEPTPEERAWDWRNWEPRRANESAAARQSEQKRIQQGDETMSDNVNHPDHYTQGKVEVIDYIRDKLSPEGFRDYCIGNVIKYVSRYRYKGGTEDLEKGKVYLNWAIDTSRQIDEQEGTCT